MKKGSLIIVKAEKMINQGLCLGRIEGKIVLIDGCLPGEIVSAKIQKIKKDYIEAKTVEIIEKSTSRINPVCKYFGFCGGCKLQNLNYSEQLKIKKSFVEEAFERTSKIFDINVNNVIGSDDEFFYRNKMEFSFAKRWMFEGISYSDKEKEFALGLHIPKQYEKVIHIDECFLQSNFSNEVRNFVGDFLFKRDASIHSLKNRSGLLKALLIRESKNTSEKLVGLITTRFEENLIVELGNKLNETFPEITTFVNIISNSNISSTIPDKILTIFGKGYIIEKLFDYQFEIYANTFFQTNTKQAEKLFSILLNYLKEKNFSNDFSKGKILVDLYSGVGVIGILLSNYFDKVIAFEDIDESVTAAKRNAEINKVHNISFLQRNLNDGFEISEELANYDITIIADPPRSGMHEKTIKSILKLRPSTFIYISCNPVTQARDLAYLKEFYRIELVQPIDMFPQTYHIENIAILKISS